MTDIPRETLRMMTVQVVHVRESDDGSRHEKWIPSVNYELVVGDLLERIRAQPRDLDYLGLPFVLTVSAALEANLNDWMIIDTFGKHGPDAYLAIADAYVRASVRQKLRLAVVVLTDNRMQLIEESGTVKALDQLLALRNRLTHPAVKYVKVIDESDQARRRRLKHPLADLSIADCERYKQALEDFDRKLFRQFDSGTFVANDMLRELEPAARRGKEPGES